MKKVIPYKSYKTHFKYKRKVKLQRLSPGICDALPGPLQCLFILYNFSSLRQVCRSWGGTCWSLTQHFSNIPYSRLSLWNLTIEPVWSLVRTCFATKTKEKRGREKSHATVGIQTHNPLITSRRLYHCAYKSWLGKPLLKWNLFFGAVMIYWRNIYYI